MTVDTTALVAAHAWIVRVGLTSDDPASLLSGVSEHRLAASVSVVRTYICFAILNPRKRA